MEISAILIKYLISEGAFFLAFQGHSAVGGSHFTLVRNLNNIKVRKLSILALYIYTFLVLNEVKLRFLDVTLKGRIPL